MNTETNHQPDNSAPAVSPPPLAEEPTRPDGVFAPEALEPLRGALAKVDWRIIALLVLLIVAIPLWRTIKSQAKSGPEQSAMPVPSLTVPVGQVTREDLKVQVPIVAEFRPYEEVDLHAKVSGYVSQMNVDFGDRVKAGQPLATLEVPELLAQLTNAIAIEQRAEAEYRAAHLYYTRLKDTANETPNAVAQQDVDGAEAKDGIADAAIAAARADVEKFRTLVSYTHITAPFDGVITHRYVDPGALIQAGTASETQSLPVVRVSDNYRLRLDFPVEVKYVKDVHVGDTVDVVVESLRDRRFNGTITRATLRVNEATRTMTTEIEVPNPNLELVPGMYARVLLRVEHHSQALTVPIDAVPPGRTNSVYVVNDKNEIEDRPVTLGMETPAKFEVIAGLKEGEKVLIGRFSEVRPGQKVEATLFEPAGKEEAEIAQKR